MGWLANILLKGAKFRLKEMGHSSTLPDNPTLADLKAEAQRIGQLAKEVQNTERPWSDEQWREISKAIENLEKK